MKSDKHLKCDKKENKGSCLILLQWDTTSQWGERSTSALYEHVYNLITIFQNYKRCMPCYQFSLKTLTWAEVFWVVRSISPTTAISVKRASTPSSCGNFSHLKRLTTWPKTENIMKLDGNDVMVMDRGVVLAEQGFFWPVLRWYLSPFLAFGYVVGQCQG